MEFSFAHKTEYNKININETTQFILYGILALGLPFVLQGPQLLVGTVVNTLLFLGAMHLQEKKLFALILMPSIGVLLSGTIFNTLTPFMLYLIPLIWIGNGLLVYGYKLTRFQYKIHKVNAITLAIIAKVTLLSIGTIVLFSLGIVPAPLVYAMSVMQLVTATLGSAIATGATYVFFKERM